MKSRKVSNSSLYVSLFIVLSFALLVWGWRTQQVLGTSNYVESQIPSFQIEGEKRLIQTSDTEIYWVTEDEILKLKRENVKFMDVTDYMELGLIYKEKKAHGISY